MARATFSPATGDLIRRRALDPGDAPERPEERLRGFRSDAGDVEERRRQRATRPPGPMALDPEAVRLVPDPLQELEGRRGAIEPHRLTASLKEDLLLALCEGDHRQSRESKGGRGAHGGAELAGTAVDQHQLGRRRPSMRRRR